MLVFFSARAEKKLNLVQQVALILKSHSSILATRLKDFSSQSDPLLVTKAASEFFIAAQKNAQKQTRERRLLLAIITAVAAINKD